MNLDPTTWLRDRADSYSRDATALREQGDGDGAVVYETLRRELRACADIEWEMEQPYRDAMEAARQMVHSWEREAERHRQDALSTNESYERVTVVLNSLPMRLERMADKAESNGCGMTDEAGEIFDRGYLAGMREAAQRVREWSEVASR